ncbi:MAG: motility associated factor glycosyltransferase family protein [Bacteroidales bacterium]|nr:motility associated factor glycosyltransferase family protein [Bacteroidales bacterium]
MDYFEVNMDCMRQRRNELYKKLVNFMNQNMNSKTLEVVSEPSKYDEHYMIVKKDDLLTRLNSCYSPKNEAMKWVEQFSFTNINIIIAMFGFGTGSIPREVIRQKNKTDMLFIYEPSIEIFTHVLYNFDISDIINDNSVVLTIEGVNEFEFRNLLKLYTNITNIYSQIRCTHPYYQDLFPESAINFWKEIKDNYIHARMNINTEQYFGERFITNALFNTRYLKDSNRLLDLKDIIDTEVPAIIVAAGPSLKNNIEELRRAKGKAYIFVVDRILDYVLEAGIEPDFIVTVDPIKPIEYFTTRTDVTTPLLCEMSSNWEVLNQHKGKKIFFSCNPYFQMMYLSQKKNPPILNTGASVATTAFASCVKLGFNKIVLVGQDLAYDGEMTHAGGIAEKSSKQKEVYVEGLDGKKVRSRLDWYEFLIWFQDMIILHPEIQVIDTKIKGAKIQGAIQMTLKDVVNKFGTKNVNINNELNNIKGTFSKEDMEGIRKFFSDTYDELRNLKKKAEEAILLCEEQIRIYKNNYCDNHLTEKNYKKISKINQYISEQPAYHLLETFITAETAQEISEMYQFSDDRINDIISTYEKSKKIFQAIIDGTEFLRPEFDKMMPYI